MTIETIMKRIEGKEKEIAKLTKKMERIQKAKATGWEVNPYYYDERDERYTAKDLESAQKALEGLKAELEIANQKANSRNIAVIIEFLENWKKKVIEYYADTVAKYGEAYKKYREALGKFNLSYYDERKMEKENPAEYKKYRMERETIKKNFSDSFGFIERYLVRVRGHKVMISDWEWEMEYEYELDSEKLTKELNEEADRKYDFIIERTNAIVGEITSAANLRVGDKGDLNGTIIGKNGTARVQTIGAGGYNIQCFHFRTLINRAK